MFDFFFMQNQWRHWTRTTPSGGDIWWICDCGPFRGEWPPHAPTELPAGTTEVAVLVCLPSPTGDINALIDNTYDTPYVWAGMQADGQYDSYLVQEAGFVDDLEAPPPPGLHLYALWRAPEGMNPPLTKPLQVVPQGMVAGSTGPAWGSRLNGHWSDWIDYPTTRSFEFNYSVTYNDGTKNALGWISAFLQEQAGTSDYSMDATDPASWPNLLTKYSAQLANERIGVGLLTDPNPFAYHGSGNGAGSTASLYKSNRVGGTLLVNWDVSSEVTQAVGTYTDQGHAEDLEYNPDFIDSLEFGVDYLPVLDPDASRTGEYLQYQGPASRAGWADWSTHIYIHSSGAQPDGTFLRYDYNAFVNPDGLPDLAYAQFTATFRYALIPEATEFSPPYIPTSPYNWDRVPLDPGFFLSGAGDTVLTYETPLLEAPIPGDFAHAEDDIVIPLSSMGNVESFTVLVQPEYMDASELPVDDFPIDLEPSNPSYAIQRGEAAAVHVVTEGVDRLFTPGRALEDLNPPSVIYNQPKYRLWRPGPIPAFIPLGVLTAGNAGRPPIIFW